MKKYNRRTSVPLRLMKKHFSSDAIKSSAYGEMLENIKYLTEKHWLDDDKKQVELYRKSIYYAHKDNGKTLNEDNLNAFQSEMKEYLSKGGHIYDGLNELYSHAMMYLYYGNKANK